MKGHSTLRPQEEDIAEPENRTSVLPPEEMEDIKDEEVTADHNTEDQEPSIEPARQFRMYYYETSQDGTY